MHIPDAYLNPETCLITFGVMVPVWFVSARKIRQTVKTKQAPFLAIGAAFSFALMMFNFPVPGGSSGHAVGGGLLAILFGPWVAVSILSVVLAIQAFLFHDGGLTTLGANALCMGVILPFTSYAIYQTFSRESSSASRKALVGAVGGYFGLTAASLVTAFLLGIQPHGAAGYFPYPLSVAIPVMVGSHLLVFSWVEGLVTGSILLWIYQYSPQEMETLERNHSTFRALWISVALLLLLSPLGILASGTAFGEWSLAQLKSLLGYLPAGIAKLPISWQGIFPNYRVPGTKILAGYGICAVIGVAVTWTFSFLLGKIFSPKSEENLPLDLGKISSQQKSGQLPDWLCRPEKYQIRVQKEKIPFVHKTIHEIQTFFSHLAQWEEYQGKNGFLQKRNPKVKLFSLLLFILFSAWQRNIGLLFFLFFFSLILASQSKIPPRKFFQTLLLPMAFFSTILVLPSIFSGITPGKPIATFFFPFLSITQQGITGAFLLILRATTAFSYSMLLALTTPWSELLEALQMLRIPQRVLFLVEMSYRYIFLFLRLLEQMIFAKRARTIAPLSLSAEQRWSAGRAAALFFRSLELSENVYSAMVARGYSGKIRNLPLNRMDPWDKAIGASGVAFLFSAIFLFLRRHHVFPF
jgi:cobalt/nickel transport system permease protein